MLKRFLTAWTTALAAVNLLSLSVLAAPESPRSDSEQANWQPTKAPLMTRWAKDVTPDNALSEYPRPQMTRDAWLNLNGLWDYATTASDGAAPADYTGKILVPFCYESALS